MAQIILDHVKKVYGGVKALDDLNLEVRKTTPWRPWPGKITVDRARVLPLCRPAGCLA